jgi:hypothetical protein
MQATDPDVERIASALASYLTGTCMSEHTMKLAICEALYEMQAISRGEAFKPAVEVVMLSRP